MPDSLDVSWAEQLISEMMAIKALYYASENWESFYLSKHNPAYAEDFKSEANRYMNAKGTSALLNCHDFESLEKIDEDDNFDDRINESHDLYYRYKDEDLEALMSVRKYSKGYCLLDTKAWQDKFPNSLAVRYICQLQEKLEDSSTT